MSRSIGRRDQVALIRDAVAVAVLSPTIGELAVIGNAVVVAVDAEAGGDIALVRYPVVVAVRAGARGDFTLVRNAVVVAVQRAAAAGYVAVTAGRAATDIAEVGDAVAIAVAGLVQGLEDVQAPQP